MCSRLQFSTRRFGNQYFRSWLCVYSASTSLLATTPTEPTSNSVRRRGPCSVWRPRWEIHCTPFATLPEIICSSGNSSSFAFFFSNMKPMTFRIVMRVNHTNGKSRCSNQNAFETMNGEISCVFFLCSCAAEVNFAHRIYCLQFYWVKFVRLLLIIDFFLLTEQNVTDCVSQTSTQFLENVMAGPLSCGFTS